MVGTKAGGLKARETNRRRHGKGFYAFIGGIGGRNGHKGGFASNRALARVAGAKGGSRSRRGPAIKSRPNIEKPAMNKKAEDTLCRLLTATHQTFIEMDQVHFKPGKEMGGLDVKDMTTVITLLQNTLIKNGAWEKVLLEELEDEGFRSGFRVGLKAMVLGDDRWGFDVKKRREVAVEMTGGTLPTIVRCYEYITGEDYMTGKKVHRGALDDKK